MFVVIQPSLASFPVYLLELEERDIETASTLRIIYNSEYIHENVLHK